MKKTKLIISNITFFTISLSLILIILSSCRNNDAADCAIDVTVGPYFLLEESLNSTSVYDNYNSVSFTNQLDTIKFNISMTQSDTPIDRICIVPCLFDDTQTTNYTYSSDQKTINLLRNNITDPNAFNLMTLSLSSTLHLNTPELNLIGDFLSIWTPKTVIDQTFENQSLLHFPVNIRNFPTPFENLNGFEYFETLTLNGIEYVEVYKTHPSLESNITIWYTKNEGIFAFQDEDSQDWFFVGLE